MHRCTLVAKDSRTQIALECELRNERDVLQEMRKIHECNMEKLSTVGNSAKTMAILGYRWWPLTAKQEGDQTCKTFKEYMGKTQWAPKC